MVGQHSRFDALRPILEEHDVCFKQHAFSYQKNTTNICGGMKEVKAFYQYFEHTLKKELAERRLSGQVQPLGETELWIIMYQLISIASLLEENDTCLGDVRPEAIFFSPDG